MKRACYVFWIFCITLSFRTSMIYGQAPQLELHLDREKIQVEETFVVTLIGKDLEQVVGIDGELLYDQEKLLLLSKEILLPEDQMIDLQAHYDGFEDSTGRGRLLLGLKGHIPPWVEAEKPLAKFIFKGQLPGEGRLWIGERSRLVGVCEEGIRWVQPGLDQAPILVQIEDPVFEEPNEEPDEEINEDPTPQEPEKKVKEDDKKEGSDSDITEKPTTDNRANSKGTQQGYSLGVGKLTLKVGGLPISVDKFQVILPDIHKGDQDALRLHSQIYQITLSQKIENLWIPFRIQLDGGIENPQALGIYEYLADRKKWVYRGGEGKLLEDWLEGLIEPGRVFAIMENTNYHGFYDIEDVELTKVIRRFVMGGIVVGFGDGTFRPNQLITREEFLAMLLKLYDIQMIQDEGEPKQNNCAEWAGDVCYTAKHMGLLKEDGERAIDREMSLSMEELLSLFSSMKAIMAESVQDVPTKRIDMKEIEKDRILTRAEVVLWLNEVVE